MKLDSFCWFSVEGRALVFNCIWCIVVTKAVTISPCNCIVFSVKIIVFSAKILA